MSTGASAVTGAGSGSSAPPPGSQEAINAAGSFDSAAASLFDLPSLAETTSANDAGTGAGSDAGGAAKSDATAATGTEQQGQQQEAAAKTQVDEWAIDQALLDNALADPTHGAIVKALNEKFQRAMQWKQHWATPEEAQEARALAPGGLEELKGLVDRAKSAQSEQAEFASGLPDRQKTALSSLAEDMPEQFVQGAPIYMEIVAQKNPEFYQTYMRKELSRALEADGVPALFQSFLAAAAGDPDNAEQAAAFTKAFTDLKAWGERAGLTQKSMQTAAKTKTVDPELAKTQRELQSYKDKEKQELETSAKSWLDPTNKATEEAIQTEIRTAIESTLPKNVPKEFREMTLKLYVKEIDQQVLQQLLSDADHQDKLGKIIGKWRNDPEGVRQQIVNLNVGRAKQLLPHVVRKVMASLTQAEVAKAAERTQSETRQAGRADVTGANTGHAPKTNFTVKDVKGNGALRNKSNEEILDM